MQPILPLGAELIIKRLYENRRAGHIVGGCVRDFLLSKKPFDYDITTDATPEEMKSIFSDLTTVETGIRHGTLTVIACGDSYEVTTYRIDGEYEDHRHPKNVSFTRDIASDLARRDFTMNAIAYNEADGFIDLFGGAQDIENRIIRAVGEPEKRFEEDALRILRAIRFSATLGFEIEKKTAAAARIKAPLLSSVSAERIYAEWSKLISGGYAYSVIEDYADIISDIILRGEVIMPDKERFFAAGQSARQLSLFALMKGESAPLFSSFCDRMKTDSRTKRLGALALQSLDMPTSTPSDMKLLIIKIGKDAARLLLELKILLSKEENECLDRFFEALSSGAPFSVRELKVGGDDVAALGYCGREIGDVLNNLLHLTAKGKIENEREALMSFLSDEVKKKNGI